MCSEIAKFKGYVNFEKPKRVRLGDGRMVLAFGKGSVGVRLSGVEHSAGVLQDVLFVPKATVNYVSVKVATSRGCQFEFTSSGCSVKRDGKVIARGDIRGNQYCLRCA